MPNSRSPFQDIFAMGYGTTFTYAYPARGGAYANRGAIPLLNHPHLGSGATTIENRKAVGKSTRLAGTGFEYHTGHKVPTSSWEFDVNAHNIVQTLKSFFHSTGYTLTTGTTNYVTFQRYTNANPDRFLTLVRKMSDSDADSMQMYGAICTQLQLAGAENQALKATAQYMGYDVNYTYTWTTTWHNANPGDDDTFDTALDILLWKNANVAIGSVYEGGPGVVANISGSTITITNSGVDLTNVVEPGSYFVLSNSSVKYGPVKTVTSSTLVLESGSWTSFSNRADFKVINFFHLPGMDITFTNNAAARAYNEPNVNRFILGDLTGTGTFNIPYGEIAAATGGSTPGFTGNKWLNLFLGGGVVPFHVWWGDVYDCVTDSVGEGDFGLSFNVRATGDGVDTDAGELVIAVPIEIVGTAYTTGTVVSGSNAGVAGGYVIGTGTDFFALGSDILTTSPVSGVKRGDSIKIGTTEVTVRYVASPTYLYTMAAPGINLTQTSYRIDTEAVRINVGIGSWNCDTSTLQ